MAVIGTRSTNVTISARADAVEVGAAFDEHKEELTWLAEFLTGEELTATACLIDARHLTANADDIFEECLWSWVRRATIQSAVDFERVRIAQLSSVYESGVCAHGQHASLGPETVEFIVRESDLIRARLDALCRFVLILCGIEHRSTASAAVLLGVSKGVVEAAYCTALEALDIVNCLVMLESYGCAGVCN